MAKAIRAFIEASGSKVSADQIRRHVSAKYPNQWKLSTLNAHLYGCVVNNPKAYLHHPSAERFLYKDSEGNFSIYSEEVHGPNVWAPTGGEEAIAAEELVEASISLERDVEDHLVSHLHDIEKGLKFVGRQVSTDVGVIDILATDDYGNKVIIEIKVGPAKDSSIGQLARYLGWYRKNGAPQARGILVAKEFSKGVRYAAGAISDVALITYRVQFAFERDPI